MSSQGSDPGMEEVGRFVGDGKRAWFTRTGPNGQIWIHVTDGTSKGTQLFSPRSLKTHPWYMVVDQGKLYFEQKDLTPGTGVELCFSDGRHAGTRTLVDLFKGAGRGFFGYPTVLAKGLIAFRGDDGRQGRELWVYRVGKGIGMVDLNNVRIGDTQGSFPHYAARFGNRALILADDGEHGVETWITDGTAKGSRLLLDLQKGPASRAKARLVAFGNRYFYESRQRINTPWDLMVSDGTAKGTSRIFAGSATQWATGSRVIGKRLFFAVGGDTNSVP